MTGVQVLVPNDKAAKLIASGTYKPVPEAEQPPPGVGERKPKPEPDGERKPGPTSIVAALKAEAGSMWDPTGPLWDGRQ